jgi:hypothetical protein
MMAALKRSTGSKGWLSGVRFALHLRRRSAANYPCALGGIRLQLLTKALFTVGLKQPFLVGIPSL